MSYIDKNLLADERVVFRTKKHLIIFLLPAIVFILAFVSSYYMHQNEILYRLAWAPWLVTLILSAYVGLEYFASDYVVTDKRVLMREGFFSRHTSELRLSSISQINVAQSLPGQFLNYGNVSLQAFGGADLFTYLAEPYTFQKSVNQQIDLLVK